MQLCEIFSVLVVSTSIILTCDLKFDISSVSRRLSEYGFKNQNQIGLLKCPYKLLGSDFKTKDWHTGRTLVQKQIWMGLVVSLKKFLDFPKI